MVQQERAYQSLPCQNKYTQTYSVVIVNTWLEYYL